MHLGEDEPAVVPGTVGGGILVDAAFSFFEAFGAGQSSEVDPIVVLRYRIVLPERIVAGKPSELGKQAVGIDVVYPY